jgi:uncharacterized protein
MSSFEKRFSSFSVPQVMRYEKDGDEKKKVVGYGAVFYREGDSRTEYELFKGVKERIAPTAFDSALERDDIRSLFNHDPNFVLGRQSAGTLRLSVDEVGLRYEVDLPDSRMDVAEAIKRGDVTGSSFWFRPTSERQDSDSEGNLIYTIEDLELREVGPVTFPAYEGTVSEMRTKKIFEMQRHIQQIVETDDSISIRFGKSETNTSETEEEKQKQADDDLASTVF